MAFQTISAGFTHACAVSTTGAAYCWGSNAGGRLGTGASLTGGHTAPAPVAGGLSFRTISAGYYHTCGVTRSGATYCWGRNDQGETGNGGTAAHGMPLRVAGDFSARTVQAAGQFDYSCAVGRDSALYCWGANCYGQLGVDSTSEQCGTPAMPCSSTPKAVHASGPFLSVSAFFSHVCALSAAGAGVVLGREQPGPARQRERSGGTRRSRRRSRAAPATRPCATGRQFSCAVTADGAAQCWGRNAEGQLGTGDTENHTIPTAVVAP